jgi:gluconokinase
MAAMSIVATGRTLALDLGSSSVRSLVLGPDLEPVPGALARRAVRVVPDGSGAAEIDASEYVALLAACLDELRDVGHLDDIGTVVTSSQWHSILVVAADGTPRSAALTWADTRAQPGARHPYDPDAFHRRTGTWQHGLYWPARIPWLTDRLGGSAARFRGLPEHVTATLLGDGTCGLSIASGTGMLDLASRQWDEEALELAGVGAGALPPLAPPGWTGTLVREAARRWPQLAGVPWAAATGDGAASSAGSGCSDERSLAVTVGTSAAVRIVQEDSAAGALPRELWRYRVDADRVVTGIAFSTGGNLFAWAASILAGLDEAALQRVAPGAHGLTALPFQVGSRPPAAIPHGMGAVGGLALDTTAAEIGAAMLEGVCHEVVRGLRQVEATVTCRPVVVLNGGALYASRWWQQAFAAAIGRTVQMCAVREMAARGAALVAFGAKAPPPLADIVPVAAQIEAMSAAARRYDDLRAKLVGGR